VTATRDDVIAYARTLAGLSAASATYQAYVDLIAPGESSSRQLECSRMSGCELVCRAVWRRFIRHEILENLYRDRQAGADLLSIAQQAGGAHAGLTRSPEPGDVVIVGGSPEAGGSEHAWTCVGSVVSPYDSGVVYLIDGIDGGARDGAGLQSIIARGHELAGGWDTTETYRRKVAWVMDLDAILARFGRP
jgi:hypothetical protein